MKQMLADLPWAYWCLWGGTLLNRMGMVVLPFLALYLAGERHLSPAHVGLLMTLPGVGGLIASFVLSVVADRVERKQLFGVALALSALLLLVLPFVRLLTWLAAVILLWSIFSETQRPLARMLVMDLVTAAQRRSAIATLRLAMNIGGTLSAVLGGLIATIAFAPLFIADAITTLIFAGLLFWLLPAIPQAPVPARSTPFYLTLATPLRNRTFQLIWLSGFCTTLVLSQQLTTFALYLTQQGGTPALYGGLMAFSSLLIILLEVPITAWFYRFTAQQTMALGALCLAAGALLCVFIAHPFWLLVPIMVFTLGNMIFSPPYDTVGAELAPEGQRGAYMSLLGMAASLGFATGPAVGGVLLQQAPWLCWVVISGIGITGAAVAYLAPVERGA